MSSETTKWTWHLYASEDQCHGPFDSKEEALEHARANFFDDELPQSIRIGHVKYCDPGEHAAHVTSANILLESMEESFPDFELWSEEAQFSLIRPELEGYMEAEAALKGIVAAWARKWVHTDFWSMDVGHCEDMKLQPGHPE